MADAAGHRLAGTEELLHPAPAEVEYPKTFAGVLVDTGHGVPVKQYTARDGRQRAWVWRTLPTSFQWKQFDRLIQRLASLNAQTRTEAGLSPWIFIRDTETSGLKKWLTLTGTATSGTKGTLTDAGRSWTPDALVGGVVELLSGAAAGQRLAIVANTATTVTLETDFTASTAGAAYTIQVRSNDWIRVRVLNVSKQPLAGGTVVQDRVRVEFIVDDPTANDRG
jgi:hypothetical protein